MSLWDEVLRDSKQDSKPRGHLVQFYKSDMSLLTRNAGNYIRDGLIRGDALLVIATDEHHQDFAQHLQGEGIDMVAAEREGRLISLDVHQTLAKCTIDGRLDWGRFDSAVGSVVRRLAGWTDHTGLCAYGEMVGVLWNDGHYSAAIRLERFWNKLLVSNAFGLFCAYPIDVFGKQFRIATLDALLCAHTHLLPSGTSSDLESAINRAMDEVLGPRVGDLRLLIKANYRPSWAALPKAEAVVLWLRNNLAGDADEILSRARQYYRPLDSTPLH